MKKKIIIKNQNASKSEIDEYKLKMKLMKRGLDSLNMISSNEGHKRGTRRLNTKSKLLYKLILFPINSIRYDERNGFKN